MLRSQFGPLIVVGYVEPAVLVLENFADGAPLHTKFSANVLLTGIGVIQVVLADRFSVLVAQLVLVVSFFLFGTSLCA